MYTKSLCIWKIFIIYIICIRKHLRKQFFLHIHMYVLFWLCNVCKSTYVVNLYVESVLIFVLFPLFSSLIPCLFTLFCDCICILDVHVLERIFLYTYVYVYMYLSNLMHILMGKKYLYAVFCLILMIFIYYDFVFMYLL